MTTNSYVTYLETFNPAELVLKNKAYTIDADKLTSQSFRKGRFLINFFESIDFGNKDGMNIKWQNGIFVSEKIVPYKEKTVIKFSKIQDIDTGCPISTFYVIYHNKDTFAYSIKDQTHITFSDVFYLKNRYYFEYDQLSEDAKKSIDHFVRFVNPNDVDQRLQFFIKIDGSVYLPTGRIVDIDNKSNMMEFKIGPNCNHPIKTFYIHLK